MLKSYFILAMVVVGSTLHLNIYYDFAVLSHEMSYSGVFIQLLMISFLVINIINQRMQWLHCYYQHVPSTINNEFVN